MCIFCTNNTVATIYSNYSSLKLILILYLMWFEKQYIGFDVGDKGTTRLILIGISMFGKAKPLSFEKTNCDGEKLVIMVNCHNKI